MDALNNAVQTIRAYKQQCRDTPIILKSLLDDTVSKDVVSSIIIPYCCEDAFDMWFHRLVIFYEHCYTICSGLSFTLPGGLTGPKLEILTSYTETPDRYELFASSNSFIAPRFLFKSSMGALMDLKDGLRELKAKYPDCVIFFRCSVPGYAHDPEFGEDVRVIRQPWWSLWFYDLVIA